VARTLSYMRATPRYASLLTFTPCDLWLALRGRTLWIAGDSQSQRFYRQLRCFMGGMMEPGARQRRDKPLTDDAKEQQVGGVGWVCGCGELVRQVLAGSS
jgi:hypothetical protein